MESTKREPEIHVRIAHVHTIKDGWRLSETTVSYDGQSVDWDLVKSAMSDAFEAGTAEAMLRTYADKQVSDT